MTSIDSRRDEDADFVDEPSLKESSIDVASAFEQQSAYVEVLGKQVNGPDKINLSCARNAIGDACPLQHRKIIFRSLLGNDGNKVVTVDGIG